MLWVVKDQPKRAKKAQSNPYCIALSLFHPNSIPTPKWTEPVRPLCLFGFFELFLVPSLTTSWRRLIYRIDALWWTSPAILSTEILSLGIVLRISRYSKTDTLQKQYRWLIKGLLIIKGFRLSWDPPYLQEDLILRKTCWCVSRREWGNDPIHIAIHMLF